MAYADVVLADTPVGYWKCNDASGNLADSSGNGYTATKYGTSGVITYGAAGIPADGALGKSIHHDGYDGAGGDTAVGFWVPDNANTQLGNGPFTLEAWAKAELKSSPRDSTLFAWGQDDADGLRNGPQFIYRSYGTPTLNCFKQSISVVATKTVPSYVDGLWHHFVWTKTGATTKVYVDGADISPTITDQTLGNPTTSYYHSLLAQESGVPPAAGNSWKGNAAHIAIYKSVLSAARVLAHYNAGITPVGGRAAQLVSAGYFRRK